MMNGAETKSIGELQLYKVLQRANLLNYYEAFISQGGDDVQQLCEAGEEEFLEIVSLVGMASKPLHVRRFQKALQEWVTTPHVFQKLKDSHSNTPQIHTLSSRHPPSNGQTFLSELYQRPSPLPNISHKSRTLIDFEKPLKIISPQNTTQDDSTLLNSEDDVSQSLDEKTVQLLAKFAAKEVEERFQRRYTMEQAIDCIKSSKKRPHIVRVLEIKNSDARNKEIRRISALFPVHLNANILTKSPLSLFELMCNEAANQLCLIHPVLTVADRSERLDAAQAVVRKVEKEIQQSQRGLLDLSSNEKFRGKADEIIAKIEEIKVKQEAYRKKIAAAEASNNLVHLLEYQSDLSRLKQDEQALLRQKGKILTQNGALVNDLLRKNRKPTEIKIENKNGKPGSDRIGNAESELNVLQSSSLADLARAHNVFDCSSDDVTIKQELIDVGEQGFSSEALSKTTVKRTSSSNSDEVLPLVKKSKPNT